MMRALPIIMVLLLVASVAAADKKIEDRGPFLPTTVGNLDCSNAVPIDCGMILNGDSTDLPNNVDYYGCSTLAESGGEAVYELSLPEGQCWDATIVMTPNGADLDLFFLGSCDESDCIEYSAGIAAETIDTGCLEGGVYYIVVDGYNGAGCPFTIQVTCEECDCPVPPCCPFEYSCYEIDFNEVDGGFVTQACGGAAVWDWGNNLNVAVPAVACDETPVTSLLGTNVIGDYGNGAGEVAVVGPFSITQYCTCLELCHFYDTEGSYDGGNVKVSTDGGATWTLIAPSRGYDVAIMSSYNPCIAGEPGFSGHQFAGAFLRDCFDISAYVGQDIMVGFFFGSDSSVGYYPGWYIKWLKVGSDAYSPVEPATWGSIKAMYK
jgi:hypothetical protein